MAKQEGNSAGGRPLEREEAKRSAVAVRTTPAIKAALVEAAEASGRSLTQEIEARLEASFRRDRSIGGLLQDEFVRLATLYMDVVSEQADAPWFESYGNWEAVKNAVISLFNAIEPTTAAEESVTVEAERLAARDTLLRMKIVGTRRLARMKAGDDGA